MNLNVFWEKNRKFLTQIAAGFAVFMILFSIASGYQSGAAEERNEIISDNDEAQSRANRLDTRHDRETKMQKLLVDRREQLLNDLSAVKNARISPPSEHSDTKFKRRKEEVYGRFSDRANVAGVLRPELRDISFGVNSDLSDDEWNDRYVQLDIVDRFFQVAVDERVHAVDEVAPDRVAYEAISGNKDIGLYRYPVLFTVTADHAALLRIVAAFQREALFVGVEIESLEPKDVPGKTGLLEAKIRLVGIDLDEQRADMETGRRGGGWGRRRGPGR